MSKIIVCTNCRSKWNIGFGEKLKFAELIECPLCGHAVLDEEELKDVIPPEEAEEKEGKLSKKDKQRPVESVQKNNTKPSKKHKKRVAKQRQVKYTPKILNFIKEKSKSLPPKELAEQLEIKFGLDTSESRLRALMNYRKIPILKKIKAKHPKKEVKKPETENQSKREYLSTCENCGDEIYSSTTGEKPDECEGCGALVE